MKSIKSDTYIYDQQSIDQEELPRKNWYAILHEDRRLGRGRVSLCLNNY